MFIDKLSTLFSQAYSRLGRMPGYTLLSMLGLVISLSGTVIITRYLHQEWTIDSWMPDRERICDTGRAEYDDEGQQHPSILGASKQMEGCQPITEMEGVEAATKVFLRSLLTVKLVDEETFTVNAISADSNFVRVFPLQAVEGTLDLRAAGNAIISQSLARKLFPDESAVGQTFMMDNELHTVKGVFREPASKSTLHYEMVNSSTNSSWYNNSASFLFTKLKEGWTIEQFNGQQVKQKGLSSFHNKEILFCYQLSPFTNLQHYANDEKWPSLNKHSSPSHLWMLFAVGVLLFLVGIFNFLNLYAVMRRTRDHEMKVRRIFGASRWNIFSMLYIENLLISAPAMLGVWMVIELTTPHMKDWFAIEQMTMPVFDTVLSLSIMFILPLIATARPTPSPSRQGGEPFGLRKVDKVKPLPSLRGKVGVGSGLPSLTGGAGGGSFLFLQYFISLTLITVSLYLMRQLHVMMTSDPGYQTENIISCLPYTSDMYTNNPTGDKDETSDKKLFRDRMKECPFIRDFCEDQQFINNNFHVTSESGTEMELMYLNEHVINVLGLEMLEGRCFSDSLDGHTIYHCIVNETALKRLELKNWRTEGITFGYHFNYTSETDQSKNPTYQIVGVMKDFHPKKQSEPQPAIMFTYTRDKYDKESTTYYYGTSEKRTLVCIEPGHEQEAVKFLKKVEKEVFGKEDLDYHWFSDEVKAMYKEDRRAARIFFTFSFLAIAVTCLGVLGLMMFDVRRRYREIALRKVHGARFRDIALLLSRRYLIILGAAACVSIPVSLVGLHKLITRYYTIHATIAWWIPFVSLVIVFLLSALTLWYQIWRATRIEPSVVMKVE